jgi:hypothetical protein
VHAGLDLSDHPALFPRRIPVLRFPYSCRQTTLSPAAARLKEVFGFVWISMNWKIITEDAGIARQRKINFYPQRLQHTNFQAIEQANFVGKNWLPLFSRFLSLLLDSSPFSAIPRLPSFSLDKKHCRTFIFLP